MAGLIAGILAPPLEDKQSWEWLLGALGVLALVMLWRMTRAQRTILPALLLGVGLGVMTAHLHSQPNPHINASDRLNAAAGQKQSLTGVVAERETRFDAIRLYLTDVRTANRLLIPQPDLLQLTLYRIPCAARPGDLISFTARIKPPTGSINPGLFDYGLWQRQRGVVATASAREPPVTLTSQDRFATARWRQSLSARIAARLPPEQRGMVEALLTGKRGWLDRSGRERLQSAGIFHLMAISGLHVGLVAGWSFFLLRFFLTLIPGWAARFDLKRPTALLTIPLVLLYGELTGWSLPTTRAAAMAAIFLIAIALNRAHQSWRALGWAAGLLLLWRPDQLTEAGFQLSFVAVATLLAVYTRPGPEVNPTLHQQSIDYVRDTPRWRRWLDKSGKFLLASTLVGLTTAPVAAHHFHQLAPWGFAVNPIAIPWVSLITMPLALATLALHSISDALANLTLNGMALTLQPLDALAGWVARLPGGWLRVSGPSAIGLGLALAALFAAFCAHALSAWRPAAGLLAITCAALLWPHPNPTPGRVQLTLLDVGQAQSALLRDPHGGWNVIDAGGYRSRYFDSGEGIISAALWRQGARRIKRLIISHAQFDHMSGAQRILRNFPVGQVWMPDAPHIEERYRAAMKKLETLARANGAAVRYVAAGYGQQEASGISWRVLHPGPNNQWRDSNNASLVVEAQFAQHKFLFPGDIEEEAEQAILARGEIQPVTLALAPHHGSRSSSTQPWVEALTPQLTLFSVGRLNRFRFPDAGVVRRWSQSGARIVRTDEAGGITLISDGAQWCVTTTAQWRRAWRLGSPAAPDFCSTGADESPSSPLAAR
ncbi:putative DNA internalization-related competence protein ComEC/Rec2 [Magnetofaba australis IT-1]|uniref:Putative DNA internalization-related competence protein ComEC/Rec2 n=1 Tax=Magnetofaba australis IT-1 TaxID=1434232 RepID=A0A1Y2K2S1_9PROT|nr:putative DNA internalization-related competence protein ComEC/Rec2 [Magnetofaba australis IT-1]